MIDAGEQFKSKERGKHNWTVVLLGLMQYGSCTRRLGSAVWGVVINTDDKDKFVRAHCAPGTHTGTLLRDSDVREF